MALFTIEFKFIVTQKLNHFIKHYTMFIHWRGCNQNVINIYIQFVECHEKFGPQNVEKFELRCVNQMALHKIQKAQMELL